ncbi:hypothetical protein [Marinitoga sp. 38H-ov]|jgi:vacuolar-type H+-ATPase subunit I/STV1|uniref:hypothetical protein n=1 Tax=Marinitoga sp. 38H-ov TaxID=1755814 RepID=UPI0013EB01F9|nr:hypothetical protein [Marinitoga sp. 38H-ov]KAF2955846.1 hypothetical protein AS160_08820 [Marinitoga sp. 38H-ov]
MGLKEVEVLKDKIRELLLSGYSMNKAEKELGLTRNDIQRYYERVSGENPRELIAEAKTKKIENKTKDMSLSSTLHFVKGNTDNKRSESDLLKKINHLEKIIKSLDERLAKLENSKTIENTEKSELNFEDLEKIYRKGEKKVYSFRMLLDLKEKLQEEAKRNNISTNELINLILLDYFRKNFSEGRNKNKKML